MMTIPTTGIPTTAAARPMAPLRPALPLRSAAPLRSTVPLRPPPATRNDLEARFAALDRFLRAVDGHLPQAALADARTLADQGLTRLRLSADMTVVALAGATGGGKSSLFNALARMELSPAGHLRPTTARTHASVWGSGDAGELLDWLRVDPDHRFVRESALDAEDEAPLRGLVLLDLPDMDSVAAEHRFEVDRLVGMVDLLIWVLDPQKYADLAVHEDYLRHMGVLRDVTIVVLNQIDRLPPADAARCLADLANLVAADGLHGVPVIGTSAQTGAGVDALRALVEKAVSGGQAALTRLEGELNVAVVAFAPVVGPDTAPAGVGPELFGDLTDQLAVAGGISTVAVEDGRAYARRAALPGWPFRRRARRLDATPSRIPPAQPAATARALRRMADHAAAGLPAPWPERMRAAASAHVSTLPDDLGRAWNAGRPRLPRPWVGYLARALWWLAVAAVLVGAGWLLWQALDDRLDRRAPEPPSLGPVPLPAVMIAAGLLLALLILLIGRPVAAARARRVRARTLRRRAAS